MKIRSFSTLFIGFLAISINCHAQKIVNRSNQQWLQYYTQIKLSEKLLLMSDIGFRTKGDIQDWSQITSRTGVAYPIGKNLQGVSGIACFTAFNDSKTSIIEIRPYQEINSTIKFKSLTLQNRFRIEARSFQNKTNAANPTSFNFRLRYRLYFTLPFIKLSSKNPDFKLLLNFGNELFINLGKEIIYNTFDNNRILIGPALQINKQLNIGLTYCYQFGQRSSASTYESSNIFWLGITQKFGFKEKVKE